MGLTRTEFADFIVDQKVEKTQNDESQRLITSLDSVKNDLFQGKDDIQPIKWHQPLRLYRLAKAFIEVIVVLWPYLKIIISLFRKKK